MSRLELRAPGKTAADQPFFSLPVDLRGAWGDNTTNTASVDFRNFVFRVNVLEAVEFSQDSADVTAGPVTITVKVLRPGAGAPKDLALGPGVVSVSVVKPGQSRTSVVQTGNNTFEVSDNHAGAGFTPVMVRIRIPDHLDQEFTLPVRGAP